MESGARLAGGGVRRRHPQGAQAARRVHIARLLHHRRVRVAARVFTKGLRDQQIVAFALQGRSHRLPGFLAARFVWLATFKEVQEIRSVWPAPLEPTGPWCD